MSHWVIDDFGNVAGPGSVALSESLGVNASSAGVTDYAIHNLGFIAVTAREKRLHVRCRPAVVSDRAVGALSYLLLDNPNMPVAISWLDEIWQIEHTPDARAAISFMSYILELKGLQPKAKGPRIQFQPSLQAEQKWLQVQALLHRAHADHDEAGVSAILDQTFHGRWSLFDVEPATPLVRTVGRGGGYPPLHPFFSGKHPVRGLESLADEEYRHWVQSNFVEVARHGRPRFDDVDAVVFWPRFGDMRTRYWRLIVPLSRSGETCRVLSASGNNSGIDLRPKDVEEASGVLGDVVGGHP